MKIDTDILTEREKEVLAYICQGYKNSEIAKTMHVSNHTIKAYVASILRKLKLKNRVLVAYFAGKNNLLE